MKDIPIILIAAMNNLGYIGNDEGDLLIRCNRDLQSFKTLTKNSVLIMGRKTYESLPKKLPDRSVVVVSKSRDLKHPTGVTRNDFLQVGDPDNAINAAHRLAELQGKQAIVIAGGTEIYRHFMWEAEHFFLTRFDDDSIGGARFPTEAFDQMLHDNRLAQVDGSEFYDGNMKVHFESYDLTPCIETVIGDFVKLANGTYFRLSQLQTVVAQKDSVFLGGNGVGFHVGNDEMNLDHLLRELDNLFEQEAVMRPSPVRKVPEPALSQEEMEALRQPYSVTHSG
jgi:dihydrofolate reductase